MKLSIIIPFHKGAHFLTDCFESVRDQGLMSFETILVLDHIKEDLSGLIDEYQDLNIKTVELNNPVNPNRSLGKKESDDFLSDYSGVAAARNAGLKAASGEYVYFLDSDDYILSDTLTLLLKEAQEQDADITYGKKASTWFGRLVYLSSLKENSKEEVVEEQDNAEESEAEPKKLTRREKKILKVEQRMLENMPDQAFVRQKAEAYYSLFVSRKSFNNVSVLGVLFKKAFIDENELKFNNEFTFYADLTFMIRALELSSTCSYVAEAIYVKRKHNDPIHYPALVQIKAERRFEECMAAYNQAHEYTANGGILRRYLETKLISYYAGTYAPHLRRSENDAWRLNRFDVIRHCMEAVDQELIDNLKGYKKRLVKALLEGNVKKATFNVNLHLGVKKLKKFKKNKKLLATFLYQKLFTKMNIKKNWVVFETFFGKSYSDSPKYIYEYLSKNYPGKYRFIWVINKKNTKIPYKATKVKRFGIRYAYFLARCKYQVFNVRQPEWYKKRKETVFLETWHGTPLKKLVFDQEEVMGANPLYKATFYRHAKMWDYLVSANHFSTGAFKSAFQYENEFLEFGYPRNDILHYENRDEIAKEIKRKLNIPEGKKTVLYAPTWRDDEYYDRGKYKFELKLDLRFLKRELGPDYIVLLRTHYFIADQIDVTGLEDFAVNVSKYDDISELYLISDLLITDYSSVFFDYANLRRPILFYTYDLDKYRDMIRGFYMDIENDVPGPLLYTNEEVAAAIKNIDAINEEYKDRYDVFYEKFCGLEDGHASENIAKKVFDL